MMKWVATGSGLVVGAVAIGACMGSIEGGEAEIALPDRAVLVSQKRLWLENFDRHCDSCFAAFELCERGAEVDELSACTVAMDACVRGGMLGDDADDAGADDADASFEEDAAIDDDAGIDEDAAIDDGDAGLDEDAAIDEDDAGIDGEDAAVEDPDDADAGIDGGSDDPDDVPGLDDQERAKEVLISQIGVCLELARSCLEPSGADAAQCVSGLAVCVQQALEEAFEVVCTEQVRACRAEKQSRANVERVERECRANLLI